MSHEPNEGRTVSRFWAAIICAAAFFVVGLAGGASPFGAFVYGALPGSVIGPWLGNGMLFHMVAGLFESV